MQGDTSLMLAYSSLSTRHLFFWDSKRQNTVETSTFGSEYCAMKTAIAMIEGAWYKLIMMGIPLIGSTAVFCDS